MNFANKTKAALTSINTSNLKPVGGGEPFSRFYQFGPTTEKAGPRSAQLQPGDKIVGIYQGSYSKTRDITLKNGDGKTITETKYKIQTEDGLVAVPSAAQLDTWMKKVPVGATVSITFNGKESFTNRKTGKQASGYSFNVASSEQTE